MMASPRLGPVPWLAWLAIAALLLLAPRASADDPFSHRIYVVGRVVDALGLPVAGAHVEAQFYGPSPTGPCIIAHSFDDTDAHGDYAICVQARGVPPGSTVRLRVAGEERTIPLDPLLLKANASFTLPGAGVHDLIGARTFNDSYHVEGRIMRQQPKPLDVQGVWVNATPLVGANVTVEMAAGNGTLVGNATTTTNDVGDYKVELPVAGALPEASRVRVTVGPDFTVVATNATTRRSDADLLHPLPSLPNVGGPGSSSLPASGLPALTVAALAACLALRGATRAR